MRPIKFRAWDKNRKEMFFWSPVFNKYKLDYLVEEIWGSLLSIEALDWPYYFEIMQFTWLLDKNGKEIYEGDIVKIWENIYIVEWQDGAFWLSQWWFRHLLFQMDISKEIIWNIYSNPDLLK